MEYDQIQASDVYSFTFAQTPTTLPGIFGIPSFLVQLCETLSSLHTLRDSDPPSIVYVAHLALITQPTSAPRASPTAQDTCSHGYHKLAAQSRRRLGAWSRLAYVILSVRHPRPRRKYCVWSITTRMT
ncbi:hypothetical protein BS17DRAFT_468375 [Gyrodon lividus]|nr:hypothetical protein BS17DRAFT_468375 [Gyrodon lividus]